MKTETTSKVPYNTDKYDENDPAAHRIFKVKDRVAGLRKQQRKTLKLITKEAELPYTTQDLYSHLQSDTDFEEVCDIWQQNSYKGSHTIKVMHIDSDTDKAFQLANLALDTYAITNKNQAPAKRTEIAVIPAVAGEHMTGVEAVKEGITKEIMTYGYHITAGVISLCKIGKMLTELKELATPKEYALFIESNINFGKKHCNRALQLYKGRPDLINANPHTTMPINTELAMLGVEGSEYDALKAGVKEHKIPATTVKKMAEDIQYGGESVKDAVVAATAELAKEHKESTTTKDATHKDELTALNAEIADKDGKVAKLTKSAKDDKTTISGLEAQLAKSNENHKPEIDRITSERDIAKSEAFYNETALEALECEVAELKHALEAKSTPIPDIPFIPEISNTPEITTTINIDEPVEAMIKGMVGSDADLDDAYLAVIGAAITKHLESRKEDTTDSIFD